jgi:D-alanyl-D-alanine carboxypeptidase/D-alanyl-D-alanine-endopeptidase (penicillin-binding protein 4)
VAITMNRSRRTLVIAVTAVVVLVVALVVYLMVRPSSGPDASGTDGGTTSTANSVADPPPVTQPLAIGALPATATAPSAAGVQAAMAGPMANPDLATFSGYVVDPVAGTVLFDQNADALQSPASTLKIITGAAVLTTLDPQSRLQTKVVQGAEPGTIVFVGGGDPTLSARTAGTDTVYVGAPLVSDLANQLLSKGVQVSKIVLDTTRWSGDDMAQGWLTSDIDAGYITRMQPLMVDGDRVNPANRNSKRTGDPAMTAGKALALALGVPNVPIEAGGQAPAEAQELASVTSQPVSVLLSQALANSDNVLAESLAREVAAVKGGAASFSGVIASLQLTMEDLGFDTSGMKIADASGLSTVDKIPTRLLAQVLAASVTAQGPLRDLVVGLPVAGAPGSTLSDRFSSPESAGGKGWIRAKTGSLEVTYALAGTVLDQDGRVLVFAFVSTGVTVATRPAQDAVAAVLRNCGCA